MAKQTTASMPKATHIAALIESSILSGEYKQGEYLPSQKELSFKYDASSRSLREAFKILEAKGLIEVSQGKKAYVKTNRLDQFVESISMSMFGPDTKDLKLLSDLLQVHITLEVSAARELSRASDRLNVVKVMDAFLAKMDKDLAVIENSGDKDAITDFRNCDFNFHLAVINSNDNIVLNSIYNALAPHIQKVMFSLPETIEDRRKKVREYGYLVDALRHGQTDLAVAMTLVYTTSLSNKFKANYEETEQKSTNE